MAHYFKNQIVLNKDGEEGRKREREIFLKKNGQYYIIKNRYATNLKYYHFNQLWLFLFFRFSFKKFGSLLQKSNCFEQRWGRGEKKREFFFKKGTILHN